MKKLLFIGLITILLLSGCIEKNSEKCSLSLCDCKCYPEGETPEEKTGRICGINCLGEYEVSGCEFGNGKCEEIHSQKICQTDSDCFQENRKCADGVDPYNFCNNGICGTRVFVKDPCLDHICPKGQWIRSDETSCFTYTNCAATGCNDNSGKTKDECIGIGTRSEGCLYTVLNQSSKYCESDNDCTIQTDNCCGEEAINKKYYKFIPKICLRECPEYNYTTRCKDNTCLLYPFETELEIA